jgi:antitoxin YefM
MLTRAACLRVVVVRCLDSFCTAILGSSDLGERDLRLVTMILVMTTIPLADAKARLSAVLDEVRDTHERVVITRNGRPEAVIIAVSDLEALEETLDLLSTPGAVEQIGQAEADIAAGHGIDADELRRQMAARTRPAAG